MKYRHNYVNVIGCGFAGCECALSLAGMGVKVHVFDDRDTRKPNWGNSPVDFAGKKAFAKSLLRHELAILGSSLMKIEAEARKNGEILDSQKLLERAREKVKAHPNIQFFEMSINEFNFEEVNVIATGPKTNNALFSYLVDIFGTRRCFDCFPLYPLIKNIDESVFIKKGDFLFLPFDYDQYIALINKIVTKLNEEILFQQKKPLQNTIEYYVLKEKDMLKKEAMLPIYLEDCQKPYAVLKLEKIGQYFQIDGFGSSLSVEGQLEILHSIKGLQNCILVQKGEAKEDCYINAPYMINEFCQSTRFDNLFFAGNIAGVYGKTESIASGLYTANNVFSFLNEKAFVKLPSNTCLGHMMKKIIKSNNFNCSKFEPIFADYDIIETNKGKTAHEKEAFLEARSKMMLERYKEELKNGKHV